MSDISKSRGFSAHLGFYSTTIDVFDKPYSRRLRAKLVTCKLMFKPSFLKATVKGKRIILPSWEMFYVEENYTEPKYVGRFTLYEWFSYHS